MTDRTLPNCILRATVDGYERLYKASENVDERLDLWRKQARLKAEIGRREKKWAFAVREIVGGVR